jgi:hypothetical protein
VVIAKRRGPDGNTEYNPRSASRPSAGDFLIVCGEPGQADALREVPGKGYPGNQGIEPSGLGGTAGF